MDDFQGEFYSKNRHLDSFPGSQEEAFARLTGWVDLCGQLVKKLTRECDDILELTEDAVEKCEAIAAEKCQNFLSAKQAFEKARHAYSRFEDPDYAPLGSIGTALEGVDMVRTEARLSAAKEGLDAAYETLRHNEDLRNMVDAELLFPHMQQERMIKLNDCAGQLREHKDILKAACKRSRKNAGFPLPLMIEEPPADLSLLGDTLDDQAAHTLGAVQEISAELKLLMAQLPANDSRTTGYSLFQRFATHLQLF